MQNNQQHVFQFHILVFTQNEGKYKKQNCSSILKKNKNIFTSSTEQHISLITTKIFPTLLLQLKATESNPFGYTTSALAASQPKNLQSK